MHSKSRLWIWGIGHVGDFGTGNWLADRAERCNTTAMCDGIRDSFEMIARLRVVEQLLLRIHNFPV
jgi:hypothetical protein